MYPATPSNLNAFFLSAIKSYEEVKLKSQQTPIIHFDVMYKLFIYLLLHKPNGTSLLIGFLVSEKDYEKSS